MSKLTKEQVRLFTVIPSILMIVAIFIKVDPGMIVSGTPAGFGVSLWDIMTGNGTSFSFLGSVLMILFLFVPPVYLLLYAFRDTKALKPLEPILKLSPTVAYIIPVILFLALIVIGALFGGITPIALYLLGAIVLGCIGMSMKNNDAAAGDSPKANQPDLPKAEQE